MIDIHCHILPDFDDGSSCLEESLDMARLAAASGTEGVVATPHFRGEASSLRDLNDLVERLVKLQNAVAQEGLPLTIYPGAEILCLPETPYLGTQGKLPTIGDSNYLLTEFYFDESASFIEETLEQLSSQGYIPVIAHPERYAAVQQNPRLARRWFATGYVLQLNKGSALGAFGSLAQQTAYQMLRDGVIHVIASDAHGALRRTPHMGEIRQWCRTNLGEHYTGILLDENPARLVSGNRMVSWKEQ